MASLDMAPNDVETLLSDLMENPPAEGELCKFVEFLSCPENQSDISYDPTKLVDDAVTYTDLLPPTSDLLSESVALTDIRGITMVMDDQTFLETDDQTTCTLLLSNGRIINVQDAEGNDGIINVVQDADGNDGIINVVQDAEGNDGIINVVQDADGNDGIINVIQDAEGNAYITEDPKTMNSNEMTFVSPAEIFGDVPKKRGRKRKTDESKPSRRQRPKKPKVYEIETPFEDEEQERKRKNALNAKKHRDYQKKIKYELTEKLDIVTAERDDLMKQVEKMKRREEVLTQQLQIYQQNGVVYPVVVV